MTIDETPTPRRGRPPVAPADKRRPRIMVHVTDEELERIRGKAGETPVSEWLRRLALDK